MKAIAFYTKDSAAIATGEKEAIVSPVYHKLDGSYLLAAKSDSGRTYFLGTVMFDAPKKCSAKQVDATGDKHLISRSQRLKWWGAADSFYYYGVKDVTLFSSPILTELPPGANMVYEFDCCETKGCLQHPEWQVSVGDEHLTYCGEHLEGALKAIKQFNLQMEVKALKPATVLSKEVLENGNILYVLE